MSDMLVRLFDLPKEVDNNRFVDKRIDIRRAMTPDKIQILKFVKDNFGDRWEGECDVAFANKPVSCFIAVKDKTEIIGFSCYEVTCKNFFGPIGVLEKYRKIGIGKALLHHALIGLKEMGYAYCIIGGGSGKKEFYSVFGAEVIENSDPGIYKYLLGME